jgi:hypothetical protein
MSDQRNRLNNGRFLHNLDGWTASGASYSAGDGDDHYGVAVLSTGGDYIEQDFAVPHARLYSLHLAVKAVGSSLSAGQATLRITDGNGNTVISQNLSGTGDAWTETTYTYGLAPGTTYTIRITNVSAAGDVKIDDVWLWWLPLTRAELASRVHTKLARLATERSLSTTPAGSLTEGSYTYGVDAGLRAVGAIDPETDLPDIRWLTANLVDTALDAIELEMLEQLQRDYAVEVDIRVGPRAESLSQTSKALEKLTGGEGKQGGAGGRIVQRKLTYEANDYSLGFGSYGPSGSENDHERGR